MRDYSKYIFLHAQIEICAQIFLRQPKKNLEILNKLLIKNIRPLDLLLIAEKF